MNKWIGLMLVALLVLARPLAQAGDEKNDDGKNGDGKTRTGEVKKHTGERQNKLGANKDEREAKHADREKKFDGYVEKRQERQANRIHHGIEKGYLTPDEASKLENQQKSIADLIASLKSDGKLSADDRKQIRGQLDLASANIWGEKHDTDGKQMPAFRLGKNVFAKDAFAQQMANENMTPDEAKALLKDFHRLCGLKKQLATGDLTPEERAKLQEEYDELLNKYFEVRSPAAAQQK